MYPSKNELDEILNFNSISGVFTWKGDRSQRVKAGSIAGTRNGQGYVEIKIHGKSFQAHRLAWIISTGIAPLEQIDHINRIRTDNRIANLREASRSENLQNTTLSASNKSGVKGVSFNTRVGKWVAQICVNKKKTHIGYFSKIEDAKQAYMNLSLIIHARSIHREAMKGQQ